MKNEVIEWAISHFGEDLVLIEPNVCAKVTGISRNEKNGKETLTIEHATGSVKYDDSDVVRTVDTEDYMFRIKHTGSWYCLVTETYCKKKEAEGILAQDIVGEILESIAEPAPERDTTKAHTVVDKFGVERVNLYIDNDDNEVIDEYLLDMKDIPLGIVYTLNTISEVNHNHAVYDGVVEYVESNDKPQIESGVVLSMYAPCPDIAEGCPFIMSIDEKDKAVIAQTPWKNDDIPVCYIMSNTSRGIIFPYLVYSFDQMEALLQNYDRCAAMFRKDVDTEGLGNKYDKGVEKSVMDMLKNNIKGNNGFFHVDVEKKDNTEDLLEKLPKTLDELEIPVFTDEPEDEEIIEIVEDVEEEHLFRQMAEYIQDNKISSMTFYLNEDGSVHCETLLRAVYPAKN